MAPLKRSAPTATGGHAKKAKEAGEAAEEERLPGPVAELLEYVSGSASASVVSMLRATLPHALVAKIARHKCQEDMIVLWRGVLKQTERDLVATVEAAEAKVAEHVAFKESLAARLEAAQQEEVACHGRKEAAKGEAQTAEKERASADAALEAAEESLAKAEAVLRAKVEAKEGFEKTVAETWEALRTGAYAGKDWRARNKAIACLLEPITTLPDALVAALTAALKEPPAARGTFTQRVVALGGEALTGHVQLLSAQGDELKAVALTHGESVARAAEASRLTSAALAAAQQASIDAQNAWVDVDAAVLELRSVDLTQRWAEAASDLEAAKGALAAFQQRNEAFEALDGSLSQLQEAEATQLSEAPVADVAGAPPMVAPVGA